MAEIRDYVVVGIREVITPEGRRFDRRTIPDDPQNQSGLTIWGALDGVAQLQRQGFAHAHYFRRGEFSAPQT